MLLMFALRKSKKGLAALFSVDAQADQYGSSQPSATLLKPPST